MTNDQYTQDTIVASLMAAVPAGRLILTDEDLSSLRALTAQLTAVGARAGEAEFRRFQDLKTRGLTVDPDGLTRSHSGRTVLVTGGTGCIGSTLLTELRRLRPERLVSISRGVTQPWRHVPGVEYRRLDIRDRTELLHAIDEIRPDLVYHLAAQHDPGLAEVAVARTLSTNVTGSLHVIEGCRRRGIPMVHASTGKALRPFSPDIYAASKKMSEWLLADAVGGGEFVGAAARFTHVVDNSIIGARLGSWSETESPVRLHSPDVSFYMQSAREAAHLLFCAGLDAMGGELHLAAIRELGWPISLMDLAVGWLVANRSRSPLYICGFEAGYEVAPYPALYDPRTSGDCSPLLNSLEVAAVTRSKHSEDVDICAIQPRMDATVRDRLAELSAAAAADADSDQLRAMVDECGWAILSSTVSALPSPVLSRHTDLARLIPQSSFSPDDRRVVDIIEWELICREEGLGRTRLPEQATGRELTARDVAPTTATGSKLRTNGHIARSVSRAQAVGGGLETADSRLRTVDLTVLVPTFNERDNVAVLADRLTRACRGQAVELLFVDDSTDDTPSVIGSLAESAGLPIRLLHRPPAERTGGLAGAVALGLQHARGRYVLVMDGDLQHPPELVPVLWDIAAESGVGVAVASRYSGGGHVLGLDGRWRRLASNWATIAARGMFPLRVGGKCSDPMTGFFCLDRDSVDLDRLRPRGFKILFEILVRHDLTVREIPFAFEDRLAGSSKATWRQGFVFLRQLVLLRTTRA